MHARSDFDEFVDSHTRDLLRSAWLLTGNWSSAEDLVQSALMKSWRRWDRIERDRSGGYVRQVMMRTYLADRRRRWTAELSTAQLPDHGDDANNDYADVDTRMVLMSAVATLPRRQRAVIVLRFFNDLTEADTAQVLNCSVGTVKSHTARALRKLEQIPGLRSDRNGAVS